MFWVDPIGKAFSILSHENIGILRLIGHLGGLLQRRYWRWRIGNVGFLIPPLFMSRADRQEPILGLL
jgi:hypothetical protein